MEAQQPQQPQQPQQQGIHPRAIPAHIENEAQDGFNMLMSMILVRVRLDNREVSREARHELIDFWFESMVEPNIEKWVTEIQAKGAQNAQVFGGQDGLQNFIQRLRALGPEMRAKFGDFILRGCDHPTITIEEAVEDFRTLREQAKNA